MGKVNENEAVGSLLNNAFQECGSRLTMPNDVNPNLR